MYRLHLQGGRRNPRAKSQRERVAADSAKERMYVLPSARITNAPDVLRYALANLFPFCHCCLAAVLATCSCHRPTDMQLSFARPHEFCRLTPESAFVTSAPGKCFPICLRKQHEMQRAQNRLGKVRQICDRLGGFSAYADTEKCRVSE
jgi:hypothetical protein